MTTRPARPVDAVAIARIYNEGIEDRLATFETEPRVAEDIALWFEENVPLVVAEEDGEVVAWAVAHAYRSRAAYAGVGEFSIYVARRARGRGLGRATLEALIDDCERRGLWKLVSRVFPQNCCQPRALPLARVPRGRRLPQARKARRRVASGDIVERLLGDADCD